MMIKIKLCDIIIGLKLKYEFTHNFLKDYLVTEGEPLFSVSVTEEELDAALKKDPDFPLPYHEVLCLYRKICSELALEKCFLLHSSVVVKDDVAFVFTAKSGTGKTTHSNLWLKNFPDAFIINGDKPLFKFTGDSFIVYGTPWCGKEGYNRNTSAKVSSLCFIERGSENSIRILKVTEVLSKIFEQVFIPKDKEKGEAVFALLDKFLTLVPSYLLTCNISDEAALLAEETMNKKKG